MADGVTYTEGNLAREASRGGYLLQYRLTTAAGTRPMKARGKTAEACYAKRREQVEAAGRQHVVDTTLPVSEAVTRFVAGRGVRAHSTVVKYHRAAKRLTDVVGDKPIRAVDRSDIELVLSGMATAGMKQSSLAAWRKALAPVFGWAEDHGHITSNPLAKVKVATFGAADSQAPRFLDITDAAILTKYLRADLSDPHVACLLMLHAGLRLGEALGLHWDAVDIEGRTITVRAQTDGRGSTTAKLKTRSSTRVLRNLPAVLMSALAAWKQQAPDDALLVCTTTATKRRAISTPIAQRGVQEALRLACGRAGVDYVNPHGLRHTAGSLLYVATGNLATVARFLGHRDLVLVTRLYVHDVTDTDTGAMIDRLMEGAA